MTIAEIFADDSWHPLSGVAAPEYIPPNWTGPHVGLRLVGALKTLRDLPTSRGPATYNNTWPAYQHSWTDALAQCQADRSQQEQEARARNLTRVLPTSIEIAHMEIAIAWPGRYLRDLPQLLAVVQRAALARSRGRDLRWVAGKLSLPGRLVRRWNREGLDVIAGGLRRDRIAVF